MTTLASKRTHEQFIYELNSINPNVEILGKYITTNTKIECKCKICGTEWSTLPKLLLKGCGCKKCSFEAMGTSRRKSNEQFVLELHNINKNVIPLEPYVKDSVKIKCQCSICNHIWETVPNKLLHGGGCPKCKGGIRKSHTEFLEELKEKNIQVIPLEEYINAYTKIKFKCKLCNYEWFSTPTNVLNKRKFCPNCSHIINEKSIDNRLQTLDMQKTKEVDNIIRRSEEFKEKMFLINPQIEIIGEYINNSTKIKCKCFRCNHIWMSLPTNLVKGRGCPNCSHTSTSFVEQTILLAFTKVLGASSVISRDCNTIGMELDIYIPSLKLAIEPGNWFWHKDKIDRDTQKRHLCHDNDIRLITLFDCFDGDPKMFLSDFCFTDVSLNEKKNYPILKSIIYTIFEEFDIINKFSEKEWQEIISLALEKSKKKTTEAFTNELIKISPDIQVCGEYKSNKIGISYKCKKCGWEWSPTPDKLLQGRGCPQCAGTMKKSHEKFVEELSKISPNLTVIGQYENSKNKIEILCNTCGRKWYATPSSLLKGHGCPTCAVKKNAEKVRLLNIKDNNLAEKYPEVIKDWDYEKNVNINLLNISASSTEKYHWRCQVCNYEYMSSPVNRTKHGCPKCARERTIKASLRQVINLDTKEIFPSLKAAGEKYGGTSKGISNACAGRVKTAYGFHWAYYDNKGPRKRTPSTNTNK